MSHNNRTSGAGSRGFAFRNMQRTKALQRKQASAVTRRTVLSQERIDNRIELFQRETDAANVAAINAQPRALHCRKTGAFVSLLTGAPANAYNALTESARELYDRNVIHPAWFDTSPNTLRDNQLHLPHEYVVYAFCTLLGKHAPATHERVNMLNGVRTWPLATVIEFAELARRALGLFGRHELIGESLDCDPRTHDAAECIDAMHAWIAAWLAVIQRKYHASNVDRARVVTLTDVKSFTLDLGMALFRDARIGSDDDYALLADISEIFSTTDMREIRAAVSYRKKREEKPGLFDDIDFFATDNAPAPQPAKRPQALRLTTANATRKIQLFAPRNPSNSSE